MRAPGSQRLAAAGGDTARGVTHAAGVHMCGSGRRGQDKCVHRRHGWGWGAVGSAFSLLLLSSCLLARPSTIWPGCHGVCKTCPVRRHARITVLKPEHLRNERLLPCHIKAHDELYNTDASASLKAVIGGALISCLLVVPVPRLRYAARISRQCSPPRGLAERQRDWTPCSSSWRPWLRGGHRRMEDRCLPQLAQPCSRMRAPP